MTIPGIMREGYATWLKEAGKSAHTITNYLKVAETFVDWFLNRHGDHQFQPIHVSALDLQDYKDYLMKDAVFQKGNVQKRYSVSSIRTFLKSLKTFFDFLVEEELITNNPVLKLQLPKVQTDFEEPRWMDRRERSRLLNYIEDPALKEKNSWKFSRNKAIIFSGLYAGLRRSEMVNLQVDDLNFEKAFLFVREGKGGKARWIPMNTDLLSALSEWMELRGDPGHPYVFVSQRGGKMTGQAIWNLCETIGRKIGIPDFGPHVLRHTFGHDLAMNGYPLERIADLMGHSNVNYTRAYLKSSKAEMRSAVESVSGRRKARAGMEEW